MNRRKICCVGALATMTALTALAGCKKEAPSADRNTSPVVAVSMLILLTLGWRESGIVAIALPATLTLTLLVFYLYGFTLNRITLFALIFSIGILVDDAIVVVENIVATFTSRTTRAAVGPPSPWKPSAKLAIPPSSPTSP